MADSTRAWARGGTAFAATVMLIIGVYQVLIGIAAIAKDAFFFITPGYAYEIDTTAWGWIHLVVGVLIVLAGAYLFTGTLWARVIGIVLASISAIANFIFLPVYPLWALIVIGLDIFVIWALASYRRVEAGLGASAAGYAYGEAEQAQRWPATNPPVGATGRHWAGDQSRQAPSTAAGAEMPGEDRPGVEMPGAGQPQTGRPTGSNRPEPPMP